MYAIRSYYDHALHADRERHLHVVEALGDAVADGAVGEQRGVAAPAGVKQRLVATDVQVGLLLAGKAGIGQVFRRGARTDGDVDIVLAGALAQLGT